MAAGAGGGAGAASPGEGAALTPTEAFTRFVDMKARYQKEAAVNRRNEIMMDQLAVQMEVKLSEVQEERVPPAAPAAARSPALRHQTARSFALQ